jgi:hypothetical protein
MLSSVPVLEYDPRAYVLLLAGFIAIQEIMPGWPCLTAKKR